MKTTVVHFDEAPRVMALSLQFLNAIKASYTAAPAPNPPNVLVVLNALAVAAGTVLAGTGNDPRVVAFFDEAVKQQTADMLEEQANMLETPRRSEIQ